MLFPPIAATITLQGWGWHFACFGHLQEVDFWIEAGLRLSRQLYGGWVVAGSFLIFGIPWKGLVVCASVEVEYSLKQVAIILVFSNKSVSQHVNI